MSTEEPSDRPQVPELSDEQRDVVDRLMDWIRNSDEKMTTVGGYAGTGKTTMIRVLLQRLGPRAKVCAFTGKAANVLRTKGLLGAKTLHSLIYEPNLMCDECKIPIDEGSESGSRCPNDPEHDVSVRFKRQSILPLDFLVVDEASMISRDLFEDIMRFEIRIIFVGDHGQLEPIGDNPNLMRSPVHRLETIHRQAKGSEVLELAHWVREGNRPKDFGASARLYRGIPSDLHTFDQVICGYNATRVAVNARIRRELGFSGDIPMVGERVVCLQNNRDYGIFNGMQGVVTKISPVEQKISVRDDSGQTHSGMGFLPDQFGAEKTIDTRSRRTTLWDFGYCITCHKAQGSEYGKLLVLEQISPAWSSARWRYTAITRASESVVYCLSPRR